ncbi:MAG: hypothetical protein QOF33_236 [Thermomicrobiales bacterium]|nr:hypothetical protein [Thermomicrobiales bacterium]
MLAIPRDEALGDGSDWESLDDTRGTAPKHAPSTPFGIVTAVEKHKRTVILELLNSTDPLPHNAEIQLQLEVAIGVLPRNECLQGDGDRFVEAAGLGRSDARPARASTLQTTQPV